MKLLIVGALIAGIAMATVLYRRWQAGLQRPEADHPRLPRALTAGAARTWVVFTTPYCASCGPVTEQLAEDDPDARVVTVDATREVHLADAFAVRSAPTVLLADGAGDVQARLVGAKAVRAYFARTA